MKRILPLLLISVLMSTSLMVNAQDNEEDEGTFTTLLLPFKKSYFSSEFEFFNFSSATIERPGKASGLGTLRFSGFFNYGYYYHYNFNINSGMYTGLSIRNTGFIDKYKSEDSTVKRRMYSVNLPIVFKFGNMGANKYFFVGAEASLAFNYKEKGFVSRWDKDKFHKWSWNEERATMIQPSVFVGYQKGISYIRVFYYPTNFLNTDFKDANGNQPYKDFNVNIFGVAMGFHISNRPLFD